MYVGLDCEMVGYGRRALLAQVSVVDYDGNILYSEYVKLPPYADPDKIDYRTQYSGVTKELLATARYSFTRVQRDVDTLLRGNIVVGHALENDFRALELNPADYVVMDTAQIFKQNGKMPSLKYLATTFLNKTIQVSTHDPTEDARTAMELVRFLLTAPPPPILPAARKTRKRRAASRRTRSRRG